MLKWIFSKKSCYIKMLWVSVKRRVDAEPVDRADPTDLSFNDAHNHLILDTFLAKIQLSMFKHA